MPLMYFTLANSMPTQLEKIPQRDQHARRPLVGAFRVQRICTTINLVMGQNTWKLDI